MQEAVVLRIILPAIDLDLRVDAKVCWSRPGPGETWYLGCALKPVLPDHVLTDLATNGFLQRRRDPRHPIDVSAEMRCEGTGEASDVRILDFSSGGLRLRSPRQAEVGQRLLLQLTEGGDPTSSSFMAKAIWQLQRDDGHEIGCTFVNKDGPHLLHDVLPDNNHAADEKIHSRRSKSRWWLLAAVLLLAILVAAYAWVF
jgi:hypothetical protein